MRAHGPWEKQHRRGGQAACALLAAILFGCGAPSSRTATATGAASSTGLVAGYAFGEGSGTTTADASPDHLNGTVVGAAWTTAGHSGNALSFNGTSSYVDLGNPAALALTGSLTVSAWVNESANVADDGIIVAKSSGIGGAGWELKSSPDTGSRTFALGVYGSGGAYAGRYSTTVRALNAWYHVAGVYDAAARALHVYVNGVLVDGTLMGTIPASLSNPAVNANIGRRAAGFNLKGTIDDVRIYARALTQAEIQSDLASGVEASADTTAPTAPTGLAATAVSSSRVDLSWTASTDDVGVAGYRIYRSGTQVGTSATTAWSDTGVAPSTGYDYAVSAHDVAGNESGRSATASVTTPAAPFDFSLAGPASGSVALGGTFTGTVTVGLLSGAAQPVTLGASGLPGGAAASFTPPSCTPPCTSTVAVATSPSTPVGAASITLSGTAGTIVHAAALTLFVTGADGVAPTVALAAPAAGAVVAGAAVAVSATASDNVGVAGVTFLLDGAPLGAEVTSAPWAITWNSTGSSSGAHVLSARATDAAGNSALAPGVGVTVDNQPPSGTVVVNGGAAATRSRSVTLTLSATDAISSVTQMRFSNTGTSWSAAEAYATTKAWSLTTGSGTKTVYAQFMDLAGNWSAAVTDTIALDTTAPTISSVAASGITGSAATITWTTSEPATSQVEYGRTTSYGTLTPLDATLVLSHRVTLGGLGPSSTYYYRVRSKDAAGNERLGSRASFKTKASTDATPPSVPAGLAASGASATAVSLSWSASTDDVGVAGYRVYRNGTEVATTAATSYLDGGLAPSTAYGYAISAYDAAGNASALSAPVSASTLSDLTAPTVPTGLRATAVGSTRIDLAWTAATDDVGVVGYEAYRDGVLFVIAPGTSWSDTGLAPLSTHAYVVAARDAAGNVSAASAAATATTPDVTVAVTPASATVALGTTAAFACAVDDPSDPRCTWAVLEGDAGGTVAASGSTTATYTAPGATGTYHVVATSVSTPRASGAAAVTVQDPAQAGSFPVAFSSNRRYLVDAAGAPWRLQADAAWLIAAAATPDQLDTYLADRSARGFNAFYLLAMVHAGSYFAPPNAPANYAGDVPFTTPGNFLTPNEPYWAWIDSIVDKAAAQRMVVVLAYDYLGWNGGATGEGWGQEVQAMTQAQATAWGTWLGNRYKNRTNVLWLACGDYRPPAGSTMERNVIATIQAIRAAGAAQLWSAELNLPDDIPSLDAAPISSAAVNMTDSFYGWGPWKAYDVYATANEAYRHAPAHPAWMQEGIYEGEEDLNVGIVDRVWTTRRGRFWSVLAGGTAGDGFGVDDVWRWVGFPAGLSSPGSVQSSHAFALLGSVPWWDLRPSGTGTGFAGRTLVTSGGGTCASGDTSCMTSAVSGDGKYLLAYYPGQDRGTGTHAFSVDLSAMSGASRARWWNPRTGEYTLIGTYPSSGAQAFTTPGSNGAGNDWVLILDPGP